MIAPIRVLFVCSQNSLRSPTAEAVFRDDPRLEVRSAGTDADAASSWSGRTWFW